MAEVFEETFTYSTEQPQPPEGDDDSPFFLTREPQWDGRLVQGEPVDVTVSVNVRDPGTTTFLRLVADGSVVSEERDLLFNPTDGGWDVPFSVTIPESASFDLTVVGGLE